MTVLLELEGKCRRFSPRRASIAKKCFDYLSSIGSGVGIGPVGGWGCGFSGGRGSGGGWVAMVGVVERGESRLYPAPARYSLAAAPNFASNVTKGACNAPASQRYAASYADNP